MASNMDLSEEKFQIGDLIVIEDVIISEKKYIGIITGTNPFLGGGPKLIDYSETAITVWLPAITTNEKFTRNKKSVQITFSIKGHYFSKIDLDSLSKEYQDQFINLKNLTHSEEAIRIFVKKYLSLI